MRRANIATCLGLLPLVGLFPMAACEQQPTRAVVEKEFVITLDGVSPKTAYCQATIATEHRQLDTVARIESRIENGDCAASSGDYTITVRIKDENGELKTLAFAESWQRDDDQPVKVKADYQIGENVDLLSVRAHRLRCFCAGTRGERAPADETPIP